MTAGLEVAASDGGVKTCDDVFFNDVHGDYLMVKKSETGLLDYLATLVAMEYVVYNNPRASSDEVGEELVRMLVRVRRRIPRRRS